MDRKETQQSIQENLLIIDQFKKRISGSIFGLNCSGGVAMMAKVMEFDKLNKDALDFASFIHKKEIKEGHGVFLNDQELKDWNNLLNKVVFVIHQPASYFAKNFRGNPVSYYKPSLGGILDRNFDDFKNFSTDNF